MIRGAFSIVYKCFDKKSNMFVAIKIIRKHGLKPAQVKPSLAKT